MFNSTKTLAIKAQAERFKSLLEQDIPLIYQTESVFGIGCTISNEVAMQHILQLKHRDHNKGFVVIAKDLESLQPYVLPRLFSTARDSSDAEPVLGNDNLDIYQQILADYHSPNSRKIEVSELADPRYFFQLFFGNFLTQVAEQEQSKSQYYCVELGKRLSNLASLSGLELQECVQEVFQLFSQWVDQKLAVLRNQVVELTAAWQVLSTTENLPALEMERLQLQYQEILTSALKLWLKLLISLGYNLTWILPANLAVLPPVLTGKFSTLACRIISPHAFLRQLLAEVETPLVSSSLNLSRQEAIKSPSEISQFYTQVEQMLHSQAEELLPMFAKFKEQECFFTQAERRISLPSILVNLPYLASLPVASLFQTWQSKSNKLITQDSIASTDFSSLFASKLWSQLFLRNLASWQDYETAVASFYQSYWHHDSLTALGLNAELVSEAAFKQLYLTKVRELLSLLQELVG